MKRIFINLITLLTLLLLPACGKKNSELSSFVRVVEPFQSSLGLYCATRISYGMKGGEGYYLPMIIAVANSRKDCSRLWNSLELEYISDKIYRLTVGGEMLIECLDYNTVIVIDSAPEKYSTFKLSGDKIVDSCHDEYQIKDIVRYYVQLHYCHK